ncbi:MAG TPA: ankyrin repeat domain-containing protein, partial [Casimicrobiaceae bacterium]|nr:ankyrin repeat domain-containing protein [Casimicrobiaceae bacterium]
MRLESRRLWHLVAACTFALFACIAAPAQAQRLYDEFVLAVANDRAGEVKALLARGMDPDTVDKRGDPV